MFNGSLNSLPESLDILEFSGSDTKSNCSLDNLHVNITKLLLSNSNINVDYSYDNLPNNLEYIRLYNLDINISKFPEKIKTLELVNCDNFHKFKKIKYCDNINQIIINNISKMYSKSLMYLKSYSNIENTITCILEILLHVYWKYSKIV
jgi:hypothetical protein